MPVPEMTFEIIWPDGTVQSCYSPSLVIHDHLTSGTDYPIDNFLVRISTALAIASERVRAKFGFSCTSAAQTLAAIESAATRARTHPGPVRVLSMTPDALPTATDSGGGHP